MTNSDKACIALLCINLGGTFSNAYGLCRMLARKFEIFNCSEVIQLLIGNQYVDFDVLDGVRQFYINSGGKEFLAQRGEAMKQQLKILFPKEIDLINHL